MNAEQQIFWTFFITTICGFILAITRQMYKSKCKRVSLCGLVVERDIQAEIQLDEQTVETQQQPQSPRINVV